MINTTLPVAGDQLVPVAETERENGVGLDDISGDPAVAPVRSRDQRGMVSAEWAVGIIAAIAIAGVLLSIVVSGPVKSALLKVILMIIGLFTQNAHFLRL